VLLIPICKFALGFDVMSNIFLLIFKGIISVN
jgi:hypothetical protein